jgi:membrane fusion protein
MSLPLFRDEALQARRHSWLGEVVLDQPTSARMLALGLTLACVGVVSVLTFGDYTRRTRVAGQLVPTQGLATVVAPVAGVVTELVAQEGNRLLAGQVVLQVRVPGATRGVEDTRASVEQSVLARIEGVRAAHRAQQQRLQAQAAALADQLRLAEGELLQLQAEQETRRHQHRLSRLALERFRQLHADRYVTDLQVQQQENLVLETLGTLQSLQRLEATVAQRVAQLRQGLVDVPIERAAAQALSKREVAALEQERVELRARGESVVKAPIAGSVGALFVHNGQAVQAGQPLLALLPAHSQLEAHLTVPGAAIGFVSPGDAVLLRYAAYPYQKFGQHSGRVLRISRNALAAGEGGGEPGFRVIVALDRQSVRAIGLERPLRPGLIVEADILGERRRLWEWLVEPLQTLRGQLAVTAAVLGEMSAAEASRCEQAAHPHSEDAAAEAATFRGCATQRGLRADGDAERAHASRADAVGAGLETDPGRNGVLALPANRGLSTKDVSCVN